MNEKKVVTNTFTNGVQNDLDPEKTSLNVLTYSLNGRVIFNRQGTMSWVNAHGNELVLTLPFNYGLASPNNLPYYIIGGIEISNYLILISTQNTFLNVETNQYNSEIGVLTEASEGVYVYQTVYNDQYDFNGDLLRLNTRYQAKVQAIFENKDTIRVYWCDDFNEDRVFNVVAALNESIIGGIRYFITPYLPYTAQPTLIFNGTQAAQPGALYPYWYSVHGMSELADVKFGLMKYKKNIPGSKLSGTRQYFYRLVHASGYATPWSTGTGMIFCTVPQVNGSDATLYCMTNSELVTTKGHQFEIKYIDTRFSYIEVAWAYYISDIQPKSAGIFFAGAITGSSMIINDTNENVVTPLPDPTVLSQRYTDVLHSKTKMINENYQHKGNVVLRGTLEVNTDGITIEPIIRLMGSDDLLNQNTTPLMGVKNVTDDSVDVELFQKNDLTPYKETYDLGGSAPSESDFINYKGTQWSSIFKGEFRGQTVPFAIVLFSRKGQPFFAQHIGDFTMPEQYGTQWTNTKLNADGTVNPLTGTTRNNGVASNVGDYTLTDWQPGIVQPITNNITTSAYSDPVIKILGKLVSGIDLTDVLFDQYGKLQVSGFSIVRADRIPNLIAQGLILNTSNIAGDNVPIVINGNFMTPLHSTGNAYFDLLSTLTGGQPTFQNIDIDHGGIGAAATTIGNYFTMELPDNLINPALITNVVQGNAEGQNSGYQVQLVGNTQASFIQTGYGSRCGGASENGTLPTKLVPASSPSVFLSIFYTKNYITLMGLGGDLTGGLNKSKQNADGTDPVGVSSAIGDFGYIDTIEKIWVPPATVVDSAEAETTDIDNFKYTSVAFLQDFFIDPFKIGCDGIYHGLGTETQVVVKTTNLVNASLQANNIVIKSSPSVGKNNICYYLANIISGNPNVLNASVIQNRVYKNIGHFVPINETTLAEVKTVVGGQDKYIFNQVEVWGGDCFVDYFGYGRLIPLYVEGDSKQFDYGCGLIFPCETIYNHTMRVGSIFPKVAFRPYADGSSQIFNTGLYYNGNDSTDARQEDFSLNKVMQATDKVDAYSVKGIYFVEQPDQPLLEMYSNIKIPGETYDQFRLFLVANQQLADSQYGWICDIEALGHNVYILQEKGFGRIRFNEYTQEVLPDGTNLTTGTGKGYQGHVYESGAMHGCQHQFSVVNNHRQLYWVNAYKGKHVRFGGNGLELLSDIHGQHSYFEDNAQQFWNIPVPLNDTNENIYDNPVGIGGISSIFDYANGSEITTFTQRTIGTYNVKFDRWDYSKVGNPSTMEFSNNANSYQGNWSFYSGIYFSFKQAFLSYDELHPENMYVYGSGNRGEFFGVKYKSEMQFVVKCERQFILDTAEVDCNNAAFGVVESVLMETNNGTQTVILNNPALDNRPVYRNSAIVYPTMENLQSVRMRGAYMYMKYFIDNTTNTEVLISEHREFVRADHR